MLAVCNDQITVHSAILIWVIWIKKAWSQIMYTWCLNNLLIVKKKKKNPQRSFWIWPTQKSSPVLFILLSWTSF